MLLLPDVYCAQKQYTSNALEQQKSLTLWSIAAARLSDDILDRIEETIARGMDDNDDKADVMTVV